MIRRDFLKFAAVATLPQSFGAEGLRDYGWRPPHFPSTEPSFLDTFPQLENTGKGRIVLLYKYIEIILKRSLPAHRQTGPDCSSQAGGMGVDFIQAIQTVLRKDRWLGKTATELLHVGGRGKRKKGGVNIGDLVKFLSNQGTLFRRKYHKDNDSYNFTKYSYKNCEKLTKNGIPSWLLKECKKHQIIATQIHNWNEARDAIRNLCPIIIGSTVGFNHVKRDKDGFAKPSGKWAHAWLLIGIDDRSKRPGGCLMNSFGDNWARGPRRYRQPKGSIWVDKSIIDKMIKQYGDSFALCQLSGLKPVRYNL